LQKHHHQATATVQSLQIFNAEAQHNAEASTSSTYTLQPHTDSPPPGMQPSMQQDPRNPTLLLFQLDYKDANAMLVLLLLRISQISRRDQLDLAFFC
jgi:hypothetical protein